MNTKHIVTTKLILPGHISFLETALSFIDNAAQLFKFSEQEIFQIRLASEEAISNIVKHALSNNIEDSFEITCNFKETQFEIVIHEKGKPFEAQKIAKYNPNSADIEGSTKGLGTFLMQKVMD
ncbi:MAG: ATP-binding protein, partial [Campylobacterota bacterium]|nr:ATP-binding protein [Campylobacterota bacterium]